MTSVRTECVVFKLPQVHENFKVTSWVLDDMSHLVSSVRLWDKLIGSHYVNIYTPPQTAQLLNQPGLATNQMKTNSSHNFSLNLDSYYWLFIFPLCLGLDSPDDLCVLYSNRAACYLKDGNSQDCIQDCTRWETSRRPSPAVHTSVTQETSPVSRWSFYSNSFLFKIPVLLLIDFGAWFICKFMWTNLLRSARMFFFQIYL